MGIESKAPASKEQATALKETISLRRTDARIGAEHRSAVPVPVVFDLLLVFEFGVVPLEPNGQASRRQRGDLHRSPSGIRRYRDSTVAVIAFQQGAVIGSLLASTSANVIELAAEAPIESATISRARQYEPAPQSSQTEVAVNLRSARIVGRQNPGRAPRRSKSSNTRVIQRELPGSRSH